MMDNAKATVDKVLNALFDRKKPTEAEKQTPHDVLSDARAELERLRDKATTLNAEIEALSKEADTAAIDDALSVKGAADKIIEIESKLASLTNRRAAIEKMIGALESPAGISALEVEAEEYDAELKREADKATARDALKVAKAKHKAAVVALDAVRKAVEAIDDDMARTILGGALRDAGEALIDRTVRHAVNDWRVDSALPAAEARLKLAAEGKASSSWLQPYAPAEPFDYFENMTPTGRAMWESRQFQRSINSEPHTIPPSSDDFSSGVEQMRARGLTEEQIEAAWQLHQQSKAA
ncbi:MAG: hypothetical protein RIA09_08935 [Hoeflea sp.]|uniref:hypothetical protein n=1 Tax=Hoeflea sp. TaxID=1940281 RepID=UPI0032EC0D11